MTKAKRILGTVTREDLRRSLVKSYAKAFGCEWEMTPWGRPWSQVLAEANAADHEYARAMALIGNLARATAELRAYAASCGAADALTDANMLGRTRAEQALFLFASRATPEGRALELLDTGLREVGELLAASPEKAFADAAPEARATAIAFLESAEERALEAYASQGIDWDAIERYRGYFATHATRRVLPMPLQMPHGEVTLEGGRAESLLPGPPPRVLHGPEWRRACLVQLLDIYPLRFDEGSGTMLPPTDGEIAVVSLLAGDLDSVKNTDLARGEAHIRKAERNAIAAARKRRAVISRILAEKGVGTIHQVARGHGLGGVRIRREATARATGPSRRGTKR